MSMKLYIYLLTGILSYWGLCGEKAPTDFDLNKDGCIDCEDLMELMWLS